ncbi:MAG TPA: CHAP domain-containing protein [Polyangia bacterium]|nr:CHAP domain-containing protein [Polyangia bacterium]
MFRSAVEARFRNDASTLLVWIALGLAACSPSAPSATDAGAGGQSAGGGTTGGGAAGAAGLAGTGGAAGAGAAGNGGGPSAGSGGAAGGTGNGGRGGAAGSVGTGGSVGGRGGATGTGGQGGAPSSSCPAPSSKGACDQGYLWCGSGCCPSAQPYYCATSNLCYPDAKDAEAACGGTAGCLACSAPVTGSCAPGPTGGFCTAGYLFCGTICCPTAEPYYCPASNLCYGSSNAAVAACGDTACTGCMPSCASGPPPAIGAATTGDTICGGEAPLATIDGVAAYAMCDAALSANVWSPNGVDTAATSQGAGWIETGTGPINGTDNGYQCTELAERYFYFKFGVCPWLTVDAKDICGTALPAGVTIVQTPVHGDLIVITPGCDGAALDTGHVAVVDSVSGSMVSAVQENSGAFGYGTYDMSCATCFLHAAANTETP